MAIASAVAAVTGLADLSFLSSRDLPTAPDGRYDDQVQPLTDTPNDDGQHSVVTRLIDAVSAGPPFDDPSLIPAVIDALVNDKAIDDRQLFFTKALHLLSRLDPQSIIAKQLNDTVVTMLYQTLPHPPAAYIGGTPFTTSQLLQPGLPVADAASTSQPLLPLAFRNADGSGNNRLFAAMGQAGQPYARSVQGQRAVAQNTLPDPDVVFDALLKAPKTSGWKDHPGGYSSLVFSYATIVIHSLFRTNPLDHSVNNTSSYLDLSPLYGINQAQVDAVRNREAGRGLIWPDSFAEDRIAFASNASAALLVIFSRNHNYIANMLLNINEKGRWTNPPPEDFAKRAQQDEEIFQIARNVNCGHFISTIFGDYVAAFLGNARDGKAFALHPFGPITTPQGQTISRGEGNQCAAEFNLLYRWHAICSEKEIADKSAAIGVAMQLMPLQNLTTDQANTIAKAYTSDANPKTRTFGGLVRQADGSFSDDDLARVIQDATNSPAGAYGARRIDEIFRPVEVVTIQQARNWGVCTMNEFREFLNLKKFSKFSDWNSDPDIAKTAELLYGHIDNLELYVGLLAEECMPLGESQGLCAGYTMTRAILADAFCLVRGDRFYTTDYTPSNLTTWGYQDCVRDPTNGAYGAAIPKLLFRHLPRHYPSNHITALFPFYTPTAAAANLKALGVLDQYDTKPIVPQPIPKVIDTLTGIRHVFDDYQRYKVIYTDDMKMLTNNYGFFLIFDKDPDHQTDRQQLMSALFAGDAYKDYISFYQTKTVEFIKTHSYTLPNVKGARVDIVRNVVNLLSVHWAADYLMGVPLKTVDNPRGVFTEQELYDLLSLLFTCVFINVTPEKGWWLRHNAKKLGDVVNGFIKQSIQAVEPSVGLGSLIGKASKLLAPTAEKKCDPFLKRLVATNRPIDVLVAQVIGLSVGSSVNYAQAVAQVIDFYLDDERAAEKAKIIELVQKDDAASMELLKGYVREAQRLNPQFAGLLRVAVAADSVPLGDGRPNVDVQAGDIIFSSYRNAQLNPTDFPNPKTVDPTRPAKLYQNQGAGFHLCPGVEFSQLSIPEIIKVVFKLKNIRRAPGAPGRMAYFMQNTFGTDNKIYLDAMGNISPWPGSLTIVYDP